MPGSNNGDTTFFAATTTAARLGSSDYFVPSGVAIITDAACSFGNRSTITHKANNVTDGFPVAADTVVTVPPSFIDNNLKNLWVIAASGTVNVRVFVPKKDTSL